MTYDLINHGFLAQFRVPDVFFFCGAGHKSKHKAIGYSHNIHTTIASVSIPCQASCYCDLQGSKQGKAVDDFSPRFCERTFLHYEN